MTTRTLFVCTFMGARSIIACEILKKLVGSDHQISCSGFESGRIGPLLRQVAGGRGILLPAESPPTVFDRFSAGELFDRVIALCGEGSAEQCNLFYSSVREMYGGTARFSTWSVRDFAGVRGSESEIINEWHVIIDTIEAHCHQLARLQQPVEIRG